MGGYLQAPRPPTALSGAVLSPDIGGSIPRRYLPLILGAAVVLALLLASPASALRPNTTIDPCGSLSVTAKQFHSFSAKVWNPERWRRGAPKQKAVDAYKQKLRCAAGPKHRRVMEARWGRDRLRYGRHRHRMQYCRSGTVIEGRVSYFGGGLMASGHYTSEPAIALNIAPGSEAGWDNATTCG